MAVKPEQGLFEPWPQVVQALESRDPMLYPFLQKSKAYYDGRRVLIDGGEVFRDYIRHHKEGQQLLKALIQEITGVHCGIGPYTPPEEKQAETRQILQETLTQIESLGVEVVVRPDE